MCGRCNAAASVTQHMGPTKRMISRSQITDFVCFPLCSQCFFSSADEKLFVLEKEDDASDPFPYLTISSLSGTVHWLLLFFLFKKKLFSCAFGKFSVI